LQPTFSYKIRGAFNVIERLRRERRSDGALVTASAGNHGRALAQAAATFGIPLTVYVPEHAPRTKLDAIRALHGAGGGATFVSPYSHPDVIAGAATVGLEILADAPDANLILVPIGGGGLISGIALAAAAVAPSVRVIGIEMQASHPFTASRRAGRIVPIAVGPTLADGLAGNLDPETVTFSIVERHVRQIVLVDETELRAAMRGIIERERLVAEGAGAAGVAALLAGTIDAAGRHVAIVLSGANVDSGVIREILE
jgi:threonine dehydratase